MNSRSDLLLQIERRLPDLIPNGPASLYSPVHEILRAGGKRARPMLTILSARATRSLDLKEMDNAILTGAAVELLHTFTLVHDDIMDNAPTRRGQPTLHTTHGLSTAILSGD